MRSRATTHQLYQLTKAPILKSILQLKMPAPKIARHILELSDLYNSSHSDHSDIWSNENLVEAYVQYFLPLNVLRLKAVLTECLRLNFFTGIEQLHDIGSGPGTTDFALQDCEKTFDHLFFYDRNPKAFEVHRRLLKILIAAHRCSTTPREWILQPAKKFGAQDVVVLSYALVEMDEVLPNIQSAEALIFIEPSVKARSRQLLALREHLISQGYYIWAPCTHQSSCPLQTKTKNDWCHNRIHVELPASLQEISAHLPMKNNSLTYSYLCARKTPPPFTAQARVIGDTLFEKGKIKQAVCRGPEREFLTWLTKNGEPQIIERGSTIDLPKDIQIKGTELRLPQ